MTLATGVTLRASASATASGVGDAVDLEDARSLDLLLDVTAVSGLLGVVIETAPAATGPWSAVIPTLEEGLLGEFNAASAIEAQQLTFPSLQRWARARWTLSSGGTATFAVSGQSVVVYASPRDLKRYGIRGEWVDQASSVVIDAHFRQISDEIDSAIAVYWLPELPIAEKTSRLPLIRWGDDVRGACCVIGAASVLTTMGVRPDANDKTIYDRAAQSQKWLDKVAEGRRRPAGMVERPPA